MLPCRHAMMPLYDDYAAVSALRHDTSCCYAAMITPADAIALFAIDAFAMPPCRRFIAAADRFAAADTLIRHVCRATRYATFRHYCFTLSSPFRRCLRYAAMLMLIQTPMLTPCCTLIRCCRYCLLIQPLSLMPPAPLMLPADALMLSVADAMRDAYRYAATPLTLLCAPP